MKKAIIGVMVGLLVIPLYAETKVEWGGLFYSYGFFWQNADFNKNTDDGDNFLYLHGDVNARADFGNGVYTFARVGAWGQFGMHPIYGVPIEPDARLLEAYVGIDNIFNTPISFRLGKMRLLYDWGVVAFDGGEDGATGVKFNLNVEPFSLDLFGYRLEERGGMASVGAGESEIPDDIDLFGGYGKLDLMDGKVHLKGYAFMRMEDNVSDDLGTYDDRPLWFGFKTCGKPVSGLHYVLEATLLSGKREYTGGSDVNYKGMALQGALDYSIPNTPLSFGGAYVSFSGDDEETEDYEQYESATHGPYTFGFYKWWPGFGPAHTMTTGYGFACLAPWNPTMINLNVINGHMGISQGPLSLRFDFFNYSRNWVPENGNSAFGNEFALHLNYNYLEALNIGLAVGYWMPGEHQKTDWDLGDDASGVLGGFFYIYREF
jgi:hypothetical protein